VLAEFVLVEEDPTANQRQDRLAFDPPAFVGRGFAPGMLNISPDLPFELSNFHPNSHNPATGL
jgi:hypothetical protein